jgi:predicted small secreted protein
MTSSIDRKFLLALAAMGALGAAACSTIAGAGEDVSAAGNAVTETAEEVEEDLKDE